MLALIGHPLAHSFSQRYFTERFVREEVDETYENFDLPAIGLLPELLQHNQTIRGFNVTAPYKQAILPYLDRLDTTAKTIGAVNCVRVDRTDTRVTLIGYNTDAGGFDRALSDFLPQPPSHALILGSGGASRAVRYALGKRGIETLTVSRTPSHTGEIGYADIPRYIRNYRLIINATPLGTWPDTADCPPILYPLLTPDHLLFDLVYNPSTTRFMQRGIAAGCRTTNGLAMLYAQAELSLRIWDNNEMA